MDAHWDSSIERTYSELRELATSLDADERCLAAAMYDLPEDLVELLARDEVLAVVEAILIQRAATERILTDVVMRHPQFAAQVSLHDNAPVHLFQKKPLAYASAAQVDRFLESVNATLRQGAELRKLAREADHNHDMTHSIEQAWRAL